MKQTRGGGHPVQKRALLEGYRLCHLRHVVTRGQGQHCNGDDQDGISKRRYLGGSLLPERAAPISQGRAVHGH